MILRMPSGETRILAAIMAIILFVMMGMGMVIPVLSLYADSFGVGAALIGLVTTAFGIARLVVNLPAGMLADRFGRRFLLWGGPLILAGASVGAALAGDFVALVTWRFLQGVGSGLYMTGSMIVVADLSTAANRGRRMAAYQSALLTGAGLGPAAGGLLASWWGYAAPFWGFAVVSGLAGLVALAFLPETRPVTPPAPPVTGKSGGDVAPLIRDGRFVRVALVTFGIFFTRTAAQWQLIPLVAAWRFGMDPAHIGTALALSALAHLAIIPLAGWLVDRYSPRLLISLSAAAVALSLAVLGMTDSAWLFWAALVLLGLSLGLGGPAASAFAASCAPAGRTGATMGLLRTVGDAGFVAGPMVVGVVMDIGHTGPGAGLVLNAALMAAAAAAFVSLPSPPPSSSLTEEAVLP